MARPRKSKKTQAEYAREWGVGQRKIALLQKLGCDFDGDKKAVATWLDENLERKSESLREIVDSVLGKKVAARNIVKAKRAAGKKPEKAKTAEDLRDEYFCELQEAKEACDSEREKIALNAYLKIDKQIREAEAHAKKLGIDKGEMLSKGEVERIITAMCWAGNALCDKFSKQIAQRLSGKTPAEVYEVLAPMLTALTLFESMKRLSKCPGEVNLPSWVVDCFATKQVDYIEVE